MDTDISHKCIEIGYNKSITDVFRKYNLKTIEIENKELFNYYFSFCNIKLSDYTFASIFLWRDASCIRWNILDEKLCIFANKEDGLSLVFPPLGEGNCRYAINSALDLCYTYNQETGFINSIPKIECISEDRLEEFEDFNLEKMGGDYIYTTHNMIELPGGDLSSKRQSKNRFIRRYTNRIEDYNINYFDDCKSLLTKWQEQSKTDDPITEYKREKEVTGTIDILKNYNNVDLKGMVLYADEKIVGFTFGENINSKTCNILIEKTDRDITGSAQYIFSEFCKRYWNQTEFCNVGDDWNIPSLAWTKESYKPVNRIFKWSATQK